VILGVKRVDQLEENLKATEVRLSDDDLADLDAASALSVEYPAWMFRTTDAARATLLKTGEVPAQR
jgi:diketogulonate reductase-like aldo/keto reductase